MILGLFGGNEPTTKAIDKQVTKVKERFAQPDFRRAAMEKLMEWGTDEALDGLLKRFTVVVQSPHWDDEEKRWLIDQLAKLGEPGKAALCRYLAKETLLTFAIKALERLTTTEELVDELIKALNERPPDDYRSGEAKRDLVLALGDLDLPAVGTALLPYIKDHSDDVQCAVIDVMLEQRVLAAEKALLEVITADEDSARVQRQAAKAVSELELSIDPEKALVASVVEDFVVKDGKLVLNR